MPTIAALTLGCKVNQYDTRAMIERFMGAGYTEIPFDDGDADVALINTCTVTATGDQKSRQAVHKARRLHPAAAIIVSGCLAQRAPEAFMPMWEDGVRLILGTQRRGEVVRLLQEALQRDEPLLAVDGSIGTAFEPLTVSGGAEGKTRAAIKIEEGCDAHCTYCVIPSVRGGVRSRPLIEIRREAERLVEAGYQELVVTGVNMSAYGKDLPGIDGGNITLADALEAMAASGALRIRLSSLEPGIVTDEFTQRIRRIDALCPHFPLALQSGCDATLRRMARGYTTARYRQAVDMLRQVFPGCAITSDILTGFPGETMEQFEETARFIKEIGFARLHVFPYSRREGTPAARLPEHLPSAEKSRRARILIELGQELEYQYMSRMIGDVKRVLWERASGDDNGRSEGYTPEYVRVIAQGADALPEGFTQTADCAGRYGTITDARLVEIVPEGVRVVMIAPETP